VGALEI